MWRVGETSAKFKFNAMTKVRSRLPLENSVGRVTTTLWYGSTAVKLPIELAIEILDRIELYATDCYDITASHIADVEGFQTIEKLRGFDIGADYPEIPVFPIA